MIKTSAFGTFLDFGKHKGKNIKDVSEGYLKWCLTEITDGPPELHEAIHEELHRRLHEGVGFLDFGEPIPFTGGTK